MATEINQKTQVFTQQEVIDALIKLYLPNVKPAEITHLRQYLGNQTSLEVVYAPVESPLNKV